MRWKSDAESDSELAAIIRSVALFPPLNIGTRDSWLRIGRGSAVIEFPNRRTLQGPLSYFAWLGVHLALLSGVRNRIETLWNWGWSAVTHDRFARIIIEGGLTSDQWVIYTGSFSKVLFPSLRIGYLVLPGGPRAPF